MSLEVHHILPQEHNGTDDEDNAAPLCASCHRGYGGNPDHRSRIREMRDHWYDACDDLFGPALTQGDVFHWLQTNFSTEELERLTIHSPSYSTDAGTLDPLDTTRFSFWRKEYVHPLIVKELLGWISDSNATIVAVDLESANRSNRFHGDFATTEGQSGTLVWWQDEDEEEWFSYRHVATTPSGVDIVECHDCGGGSGVFGTVALFCVERDRALDLNEDESSRDRTVLKTLGQFSLGDRYRGEVSYRHGVLEVGPDHGWFQRGEAAAWKLPVL